MDSWDFTGKTAIITGAGRGLGAAFAVVLADCGADVIITGRNKENLNSLAESIRLRTGKRPETILLDMADPGLVTRTAKTMRDEMAKLDILINNASPWLPGKMTEHDAHAIAVTINAALTGTILFTRGLIQPLERSNAGDILNIVSISGIPNVPLLGASVAYYAAKHGQAGFTNGLRQELKGRPIRVSALFPSNIEDISPLDAEKWDAKRPENSWATNRDVVETGLFAISRPRHVTLASIVIDPDHGGLYSD